MNPQRANPQAAVSTKMTVTYALARPARLDLESFARVTGTHPDLSRSSQNGMWEEFSRMTSSAPSMAPASFSCSFGVASSCRPEMTRAGTPTRPSRSSADQSLNEPTTWNSDGPLVVWYTVGSVSMAAKERSTSAGHGSIRQR